MQRVYFVCIFAYIYSFKNLFDKHMEYLLLMLDLFWFCIHLHIFSELILERKPLFFADAEPGIEWVLIATEPITHFSYWVYLHIFNKFSNTNTRSKQKLLGSSKCVPNIVAPPLLLWWLFAVAFCHHFVFCQLWLISSFPLLLFVSGTSNSSTF